MREKPMSFSAALDQQRRAQIDNAGLDRFAPSGRVIDYPITFLQPGGPVVDYSMRVERENQDVTIWFNIPMGGASSYGNSTYFMEVPYDFTGSSGWLDTPIGTWVATKNTDTEVISGWIEQATGINGQNNLVRFKYRNTAGVGAPSSVASTLPWIWVNFVADATMRLKGFMTYESADSYTP